MVTWMNAWMDKWKIVRTEEGTVGGGPDVELRDDWQVAGVSGQFSWAAHADRCSACRETAGRCIRDQHLGRVSGREGSQAAEELQPRPGRAHRESGS